MRLSLMSMMFGIGLSWSPANSFHIASLKRPTSSSASSSSTARWAGFGASVATKTKNNKNNKNVKKKNTSTPFDASASLLRMEKIYDELSQNEAKRINRDDDTFDPHELVTAEYIVATRCSPIITDWVPIAQIILARPLREAEASEGSADPLVRAAVSQYCREISHVAGMGSRVFQSVPRNGMQYAVESVESFHKHVYEVAFEGKNENPADDNSMTKAKARQILQIDDATLELSDIKRTYRKLSMECHPDRFVGESEEVKLLAAEKYSQIKLAYETLQSGIRNGKQSWYESLGGRARTDFSLVAGLLSLKEAEAVLNARHAKAAVCGLDPELVQTFVARSQSGSFQ